MTNDNSERKAVDEEIDRESFDDMADFLEKAGFTLPDPDEFDESLIVPAYVMQRMQRIIDQLEQRQQYAMSKLMDEVLRLSQMTAFGSSSPSDRLKTIAVISDAILHLQRGFDEAGRVPEYKAPTAEPDE